MAKELVEEEEALLKGKGSLPEDAALISAKKNGFSDKYLSQILEIPEEDKEKHVFLRVTARDRWDEKLFSNAFMLLQN